MRQMPEGGAAIAIFVLSIIAYTIAIALWLN